MHNSQTHGQGVLTELRKAPKPLGASQKMVFAHSNKSSLQTAQPRPKKVSPDITATQQHYMTVDQANHSGSQPDMQSQNIMNFLKRRASEEKNNYKKSGSNEGTRTGAMY